MKYYEEMRTKYGFSDGDAVPVGMEKYREVYIRAINAMAAKCGSSVRAYPYDRPGMHNWCLIVLVDESFGDISPKGYDVYPQGIISESDEQYDRALEIVMEMAVDQWLNVKVKIDKDFDSALNQQLLTVT